MTKSAKYADVKKLHIKTLQNTFVVINQVKKSLWKANLTH